MLTILTGNVFKMRSFTVLSLISAGAICAFALGWFFFSTTSDEKQFQQQTSVSSAGTVNAEAEKAPPLSDFSQIEPQEVSPPEPELLSSSKDIPFTQSENAEPETGTQQTAHHNSPPEITIARIDPEGSAVLAGTAAPHASIIISENGREIGRTTADAAGEWVAVLDENLAQGEHLLIVEMKTEDGVVIPAERAIVAQLMGDEAPLVAIVPMGEALKGASSEVDIVSLPQSLEQPQKQVAGTDSQVAQTPANSVSQAQIAPSISIFTLAWQTDRLLAIKGEAVSGKTIQLGFGDQQAKADYQDNRWSASIALPAKTSAVMQLSAELFSAKNELLASTSLDIDVRQLDIGKDGSEMVVVKKGDMLWRIAYRTYGSGIRYLDIVKRNQKRIDDPDLIYPAQIFSLPAQ